MWPNCTPSLVVLDQLLGGEIDLQSDVTGQKRRFFGHKSHVYRSNALKITANMHRIKT